MKFTILGGHGFIGRNLKEHLSSKGHDVFTPDRDDISNLGGSENLGHVIYAIGLTGNARQKPFEAVEAHVGLLSRLIPHVTYDSWLYLSSTRLYGTEQQTDAREEQKIVTASNPEYLFDVSKILGESLCRSVMHPAMRIARLSNVYGAGQSVHTFLGSILHDLHTKGSVTIGEDPLSAKDYISIKDAVGVLEQIALNGREEIYNVASGRSVTHKELSSELEKLGYRVDFVPEGAVRTFPPINNDKIRREFGYSPSSLLNDLSELTGARHV